MIIYGINPTLEALRAGTATEVRVSDLRSQRLAPVVALAARAGITVRRIERAQLNRLARGGTHQGVIAEISGVAPCSVRDLVRCAAATPLIAVLDGIEDPQNFGAVVRSAEAAGVDGVVRQIRRAAPASAAAMKASAGALAHVKVASVVNISRAMSELKSLGVWTVGLDDGADHSYDSVDLTQPTALVVGAEGTGLRRLVREGCDRLVSIPMRGRVLSLNASVALGIALFEAVRQRADASAAGRPRDRGRRPPATSV